MRPRRPLRGRFLVGHSWISITGWVLLALTCAFAWAKGALPERLGAAWVLGIDLASDLAMAMTFPHTPELVLFAFDLILALGLLALAFRFNSLWLGLAMLLQSVALFAHALVLGEDGLSAYCWMIANDVISQLMLGCIVAATIASWRASAKTPSGPVTGKRTAARQPADGRA